MGNVVVTETLTAANAELPYEVSVQPHDCPRMFSTLRDFCIELYRDEVCLSLGQKTTV
jgi:hypothetical protein